MDLIGFNTHNLACSVLLFSTFNIQILMWKLSKNISGFCLLETFYLNKHSLPCCLQVINEIIESCRARDFTDIILVHEHRGVPDGLIVCHLPFGPTAYFGLHNVVSIHPLVLHLRPFLHLCVMKRRFISINHNTYRLPDMTSRTRIQLEQCQGLFHISFLTISQPRYGIFWNIWIYFWLICS